MSTRSVSVPRRWKSRSSEAGGGRRAEAGPLERRALQLVCRGYANKLIAYELDLSESTVAEYLARACRRLGYDSTLELIVGLVLCSGRHGNAAARLPHAVREGSLDSAAERLTASERAIAAAVIEGRSNKVIAADRGSSPRTVANQLAHLYRKLGVQSRRELVVWAARASARASSEAP